MFRFMFLAIAIVVSGCANTSTIKTDAARLNGKTVQILPTGNIKIEALSNTVGSGFGLLGALIENAATADSQSKVSAHVSELLPPAEIIRFASDEITRSLNTNTHPAAIRINNRTLETLEFTDWFNPNQRTINLEDLNLANDLVVDFGFHGIVITTYMTGQYIDGALGIRIIEPVTGEVIARVRTWGNGEFGGEKILDNSANSHDQEIKLAMERFIKRLVHEAMKKLI